MRFSPPFFSCSHSSLPFLQRLSLGISLCHFSVLGPFSLSAWHQTFFVSFLSFYFVFFPLVQLPVKYSIIKIRNLKNHCTRKGIVNWVHLLYMLNTPCRFSNSVQLHFHHLSFLVDCIHVHFTFSNCCIILLQISCN